MWVWNRDKTTRIRSEEIKAMEIDDSYDDHRYLGSYFLVYISARGFDMGKYETKEAAIAAMQAVINQKKVDEEEICKP